MHNTPGLHLKRKRLTAGSDDAGAHVLDHSLSVGRQGKVSDASLQSGKLRRFAPDRLLVYLRDDLDCQCCLCVRVLNLLLTVKGPLRLA